MIAVREPAGEKRKTRSLTERAFEIHRAVNADESHVP
jgi:hypothetical protein